MFLVSVDPATGSSSLPAFALWELDHEGMAQLIHIKAMKIIGKTHWQRMRFLSFELPTCLLTALEGNRNRLDNITLVVEGLPPTMGSLKAGGANFSNAGSIHLHHAVAVIATCLDWKSVDEIPVARWKSFLRAIGAENSYVKSDANDAVVVGLAALCFGGFNLVIDEFTEKMMDQMGIDIDKMLTAWDGWSAHINKAHEKNVARKKGGKKK